MSQADIETLRAGYNAFNSGDWDSLFAYAHPDIELKPADRAMTSEVIRGSDAIKEFFQELFMPFETVVVKPQRFFEEGDRIAVILQTQFRPHGSTAMVENRVGHLWTTRDGKFVRLEVFPERERALEALGMSESEARSEAA